MGHAVGFPRALWAITSYFNPIHYRSRRSNYHLFREQLNLPLVAVELSFDGHFELTSDDAEILIQKSGGDVMWQKERLLNIAMANLPTECQSVVWIDCDVVFQRTDLAEQILRELERAPLVQLFSLVHDIAPKASL